MRAFVIAAVVLGMGCEAPFCKDENGEYTQEACLDRPKVEVHVFTPDTVDLNDDDGVPPACIEPVDEDDVDTSLDAGVPDAGTTEVDVDIPGKKCKNAKVTWCRGNRCLTKRVQLCAGAE